MFKTNPEANFWFCYSNLLQTNPVAERIKDQTNPVEE